MKPAMIVGGVVAALWAAAAGYAAGVLRYGART